jgi:hypothetical protein
LAIARSSQDGTVGHVPRRGRPDIAERVLGHAINGFEGVYDRHQYREEKAHALVGLIERIVNPPADNVVSLPEASAL